MKVSVIIPYKADRGFLKDCVDSCKFQVGFTLGRDYEIIQSNGPGSLGANINNGLQKAKGEFIKIVAEDDLLTENCLRTLYDKAIEGYDLVCANSLTFNGTGITGQVNSEIPKTVHKYAMQNTIHGGTVLYRRSAMGLWRPEMWTAEEYEIQLRMAASGCRFGYVDAVVYMYRRWKGQKSGGGETPWIKGPDGEIYRFEYVENLQAQYIGNYLKVVR